MFIKITENKLVVVLSEFAGTGTIREDSTQLQIICTC